MDLGSLQGVVIVFLALQIFFVCKQLRYVCFAAFWMDGDSVPTVTVWPNG